MRIYLERIFVKIIHGEIFLFTYILFDVTEQVKWSWRERTNICTCYLTLKLKSKSRHDFTALETMKSPKQKRDRSESAGEGIERERERLFLPQQLLCTGHLLLISGPCIKWSPGALSLRTESQNVYITSPSIYCYD